MAEAQRTTTPGRPWQLWVIGIIGGLWSAIGLMSFMLTQMNVDAVMSRFPPQQREYFESFPLWGDAFWAIGVFGGVIGCLLLLLENRLAFHVLLASAIGTIVTNLGGLFLLGGMQVMRETNALGVTVFPIVTTAFLAYYASGDEQAGRAQLAERISAPSARHAQWVPVSADQIRGPYADVRTYNHVGIGSWRIPA